MTENGNENDKRNDIEPKAFVPRPYGVMVSHQLDVLRVPGSIPGEANFFNLFFIFYFFFFLND